MKKPEDRRISTWRAIAPTWPLSTSPASAWQSALPNLRRALAIIERRQGTQAPALVPVLDSLASVFIAQENYRLAESPLEHAISIEESNYGPNDANVATYLDKLGEVYYREKRYAEAAPVYRRSLAIWETVLGPATNLATTLDNLAVVYASAGRFEEAEPLYNRSLALRQATVVQSLNNHALALEGAGQDAAAERDYKQALALAGRIPSLPRRRECGRSRAAGANAEELRGAVEKAQTLYRGGRHGAAGGAPVAPSWQATGPRPPAVWAHPIKCGNAFASTVIMKFFLMIVEANTVRFDSLALDCGATLAPVGSGLRDRDMAAERLAKSNAILALHASSGDVRRAGISQRKAGLARWNKLIGPGKAFQHNEYFVICSNVARRLPRNHGTVAINRPTGCPCKRQRPGNHRRRHGPASKKC